MALEWSDVSKLVGGAAPLLGTLLYGPAGATVGALIGSALGVDAPSPDNVAQALKSSPDAAVKLRQIEADQAIDLRRLLVASEANRLSAETARILAVNATMQAEAAADHWPTYAWRPFIGFVFGSMMFGIYFILPLAKIVPPVVPAEAWIAMGAILGVASWYRGKMQADPNIPTDNRG